MQVRIYWLYICGKADLVYDLLVVSKFLLRRVNLAKHYIQEGSWVLGNLILVKNVYLGFKAVGKANPLKGAI